jgi:hypothetical protein
LRIIRQSKIGSVHSMLRVSRSYVILQGIGLVGLIGLGLGSWGVGHWLTKDTSQVVTIPDSTPPPITPLVVLEAHQPKLIEFETWATQWETAHSSTRPSQRAYSSPEDAQRIQDLAAKSDLSATECLVISKAVGDHGDFTAARALAVVGVDRAEKELAGVGNDDPNAIPLRDAVHSAEASLWDYPGNGPLLERMASLVMRFDRSSDFDQTPEWSRIAHAEALYMQGRYEKATAEIQLLDEEATEPNSDFTAEQKIHIQWVEAGLFLGQQQYAAAVPHLRAVVDCETFKYWKSACNAYFFAAAMADDEVAAQHAYKVYFKKYGEDHYSRYMKGMLESREVQARALFDAR